MLINYCTVVNHNQPRRKSNPNYAGIAAVGITYAVAGGAILAGRSAVAVAALAVPDVLIYGAAQTTFRI